MECSIFVTHDCNMKCKYCYENKNLVGKMSIEVIKSIMDMIVNKDKNLYIKFFGGEPLLNYEAIEEAVEYIESIKYDTSHIMYFINTNLTLIDDSIISFFKRNDFNVKMSLDGDAESFCKNRIAKISYNEILSNAKRIHEAGIKNAVRMTVCENTLDRISDNVKYIFTQGFKNIEIGLDVMHEYTSFEIDLIEKEYKKLAVFYCDKLNEGLKLNIFDGQFSKFVFDFGNSFIMCGGGISSLKFDTKGNLYPCNICVGDERFRLGNVENVKNAESTVLKLARDKVLESTKCDSCDIRYYCQYMKCGYINYYRTGYYNQPTDDHCRIEKMSYNICKEVFKTVRHIDMDRLRPYYEYARDNNLRIRNIE